MTSRVVAALALALVAASLGLLVASWSTPAPEALFSFRGTNALNALAFVGVGLLIVTRRPANLIGGLLINGGLASALYGFAVEYAVWTLGSGVAAPGGMFAAWVVEWIWVPLVGLFAPLLLLVFPTGTLPSARWRAVIWAGAGVTVLGMIATALRPGDLRYSYPVPNPFGTPDLKGVVDVARAMSEPLSALVLLAAMLSLVARFRAGSADVRLQVKWFALAGAVSALSYALALAFPEVPVFERGVTLSGLAMPTAIGVAVLRYRLYDIDVILRRTLVYGALSVALVATYVAAVILFQAALRPLTAGSELAVAASTLAVVALVQPLRRRIQAVVDHRFFRSRYDASRTLDAFTTRMRDQVDIDAVRGEVLSVVGTTLQPAHASVWLRERA